jgi:hypothetical protein
MAAFDNNFDGLKQPKGFTGQNFGTNMYSNAADLAYGQEVGNPGRAGMVSSLADAQSRAAGTAGPSLAETQLKQGQESALRGAVALAGQSRGGNIAGQQMQAANAGAGGLAAANSQAATMRIQEQQIAQEQAAAQAQAAAGLQLNYQQLAQQGQLGQQGISNDYELGKGQLELDRQKYHTDRNMGWAKVGSGFLGSIIGGALGGSDERLKHDVQDSTGSIADDVGNLPTKKWGYNDPTFGPTESGSNAGILAQDLEKSPFGAQTVIDTPQGKMINGAQTANVALAATAEQQKRIQELERQVGQRNEQGNFSNGSIDDAQMQRDLDLARKSYGDLATHNKNAAALAGRDADRYAIPQDSYRGRNPTLVGAQTVDPFEDIAAPQPSLKDKLKSAYSDVARQFGFEDEEEDSGGSNLQKGMGIAIERGNK